MKKSERFVPFIFLSPALLLLAVFRIYPIIATFTEALYKKGFGLNAVYTFVGPENFERVINDPILYNSLFVTLKFCLIIIPIQIFLALGLAVLANQKVPGIAMFRSIYLLPVAVSPVVSTTIWQLMLDKTSGFVNGILFQLGLPTQPFFLSKEQALWAVMLVASWRGIPYFMMFFLAGLQEIPEVLKEAAAIDGANRWQTFWRITFPLLRRVTVFVLVTGTVLNFILFAPILLITRGGPQESTNLIMWEAYRRGFLYGDLGASAAMMTIIVGIVLILVAFEFWVLRSDE